MSAPPVRIGISGLGSFAAVLSNAVAKTAKASLTACYSRTPGKREAFAARYGCTPASSFDALVRRDDVDAVVLATPNAVHREQAEIAARHGKHVFAEKPIANTLADAHRMIDACTTAGVVLMVGHVARRHAGNRVAKRLIDDGAIGKPIMVEANLSSEQGMTLVPSDFRWKDDDDGCPAGPLMTMGIHHADTLTHLFGPVDTVYATFNRLQITAPIPDVTAAVLRFRNGMLGYIGSSFASPRTNWMRVYGTEANLVRTFVGVDRRLDPERKRSVDENTTLELVTGTEGVRRIALPIGDPIVEQIEEFADCIRDGRRPETDGRAALQPLAVIRAAIRSTETGMPEKVIEDP